jgi:hypothetical protein
MEGMMSYNEAAREAIDDALATLLLYEGRHASVSLVLTAGASAGRQWGFIAKDSNGKCTAFGHWVLRRWGKMCDNDPS